jgi:hypothetical protein
MIVRSNVSVVFLMSNDAAILHGLNQGFQKIEKCGFCCFAVKGWEAGLKLNGKNVIASSAITKMLS